MSQTKISIVTTLYKSEGTIGTFITEYLKVLKEIGIEDFEFVIVNDGSPDNSLEKTLEFKKELGDKLKVIDFSRNFGHHIAFFAGMSLATGELIYLADSDLEVDTLNLKKFYEILISNRHLDYIYGYLVKREDRVLGYLSGFFWNLFSVLSGFKFESNITTERLMRKDVSVAITSVGDRNLFMGGIYLWVGFNGQGVEVVRKKLRKESTYSVKKRIKLALDAITSFSERPLYYLFTIGITTTFFSFIYALFLLIRKLLYTEYILSGYTSIMLALSFSIGLNMLCVGLIGVYIGKIFNQVKNRPLYIIKNIY
ncbi:MAG: bactoprenol glucosyl transferase [Bacteroidia bacterium]|nr:MAG: bactoprenol glucosyl transferase [Bacteroidia bacterium]